jgi:hypothetical protein
MLAKHADPYVFLMRILVWWESATAPQPVLNRRLDDKIRHLCGLAILAKDDDAWLLFSELRVLITQHVEHLRIVAAAKLSGKAEFVERRQQNRRLSEIPNPAKLGGRE